MDAQHNQKRETHPTFRRYRLVNRSLLKRPSYLPYIDATLNLVVQVRNFLHAVSLIELELGLRISNKGGG